jgi:hypothetical protein
MRRLRRVIQAVIVDYEGICNFKKRWKEREMLCRTLMLRMQREREREVAAAAVVCNLFFSLLSV